MKKLTAEEKLARVREGIADAFAVSDISAILECPYGDHTHQQTPQLMPDQHCRTCSRLDGSECVDEYLDAYDEVNAIFDQTPVDTRYDMTAMRTAQKRRDDAMTAMRAWRASKRR
jgi:hypothetical protein